MAKLITTLTVLQKYPLASGRARPDSDINCRRCCPLQSIRRREWLGRGSASRPSSSANTKRSRRCCCRVPIISPNSLAIWAYGSLGGLCDGGQPARAGKLGLTQTVVGSDASGFDPSTASTPADLVKLGEAALAEPVVAQIVAEPQAPCRLPVSCTTSTRCSGRTASLASKPAIVIKPVACTCLQQMMQLAAKPLRSSAP